MSLMWEYVDPYQGVAESAVTSNPIPLYDSINHCFSFYTISGSVSTHTLQYSNSSVGPSGSAANILENSWVSQLTLITRSLISDVVLGARWARFLRQPSQSSSRIDFNKHI